MDRQTCGYKGHVCSYNGEVQFISRYHDQNDYCVEGRRVTIGDDGTTRHAESGDVEKIRLFELERYADYLRWRRTCGFEALMQPFDFPVSA